MQEWRTASLFMMALGRSSFMRAQEERLSAVIATASACRGSVLRDKTREGA